MNKKNIYCLMISLALLINSFILITGPAQAVAPYDDSRFFQRSTGQYKLWNVIIEPNLKTYTGECVTYDEGGDCVKFGPYELKTEQHPAVITVRIINIVYTILGIVFMLLTLYSGFTMMFASGNKETVTKSLNILENGVFGLIVVIAAYAITYFIVTNLFKITY
jgi:hypothetical protein